MERTFDELRNYTNGLTTYMKKLDTIPLSQEKASQEIHRSMKLTIEYLSDTIDSVEQEFKKMEAQVKDIATDHARYSSRSTALVNDVIKLDKRVVELESLKASVDNLTNIILRNIKNFPTSGGELEEDEEDISYEIVELYHRSYNVHDFMSTGCEFTTPETFEGTVTVNGYQMEENKGDMSITISPGFKTYHIFGPMHRGDVVEFQGKVINKEK